MTATDPQLAAMPAERLAPAAALASACAEDDRAVRGDGQGPWGCASPQTEGKSHEMERYARTGCRACPPHMQIMTSHDIP